MVVLDPTGHYQGLWSALERWIDTGFVRPLAWSTLVVTADLDHAIDAVTTAEAG